MIPQTVIETIKKHGKKVAPNDFEKTKLARKYNPKTRELDEMIDEYLRYISL